MNHRGAYCASVIIKLLGLPLDLAPESPAYKADGSSNLFTGVADYVRRCKYHGRLQGIDSLGARSLTR